MSSYEERAGAWKGSREAGLPRVDCQYSVNCFTAAKSSGIRGGGGGKRGECWVGECRHLKRVSFVLLLARKLRKFVAIRCPHLFMHVFLTMWQMAACHPPPPLHTPAQVYCKWHLAAKHLATTVTTVQTTISTATTAATTKTTTTFAYGNPMAT